MMMKRSCPNIVDWAIGLLVVSVLISCTAGGGQEGELRTSSAYREYFGPPPVVAQGQCFARVGYLAKGEAMDQMVPIPLFLFEEEGQMGLLVERLIAIKSLMPLPAGLLSPFPEGTTLNAVTQQGGRVEVSLGFAENSPKRAQAQALSRALVLTLGQLPGVERVAVTSKGAPLAGTPEEGLKPERAWVSPPGPPRLLMVVGEGEHSEGSVREILFNFDRPIEVERLRLTDAGGREIRGEIYRSAFDMAVVLHPADREAFREGTPIMVDWAVRDRLKRPGAGKGTFRVMRSDHGARRDEGGKGDQSRLIKRPQSIAPPALTKRDDRPQVSAT